MKKLYHAQVAPGLSYECQADCDLDLKKGDRVVVKCERFTDLATIAGECDVPAFENESELAGRCRHLNRGRHIEGQKVARVLRLATEPDLAQGRENEARAEEAHRATRERIRAHRLSMRLIHSHYSFDRKMIVFQFSAEGRVDFRELLRDLSGLLRVRVELRQVGVRDEAAILGGIGTCGRPFCCATFLPSFSSINVKMAKLQGLSLTPQNISGACGRLKCCLQYEAEAYRQAALERKRKAEALAAAGQDDPDRPPAGDQDPAGRPPLPGDGRRNGQNRRRPEFQNDRAAARPRREDAPRSDARPAPDGQNPAPDPRARNTHHGGRHGARSRRPSANPQVQQTDGVQLPQQAGEARPEQPAAPQAQQAAGPQPPRGGEPQPERGGGVQAQQPAGPQAEQAGGVQLERVANPQAQRPASAQAQQSGGVQGDHSGEVRQQ